MLNLKTPGVFIQEIRTLPASVAPVATAIPAFVGYTQKRELNGTTLPDNEPVRITSLLEYEEIFGFPFDENYNITVSGPNDDATVSLVGHTYGPYILYYAMQVYFSNGGGPCYVVSAGVYDLDGPKIEKSKLLAGISALEQEDEPTILLVPESYNLDNAIERLEINNALLAQCNLLQDRFALLDVYQDNARTVKQNSDDFRNNEVGISYLNYGAAYYPPLNTSISRYYSDRTVNVIDSRVVPIYNGESLQVLQAGSGVDAIGASATLTFNSRYKGVADQTISIGAVPYVFNEEGGSDPGKIDIGVSAATTAANFAAAVNGNAGSEVTATVKDATVTVTAKVLGVAGNDITLTYLGSSGLKLSGGTLEGGSAAGADVPDISLFNQIKNHLDNIRVTLPPSAAIAGVYARVDRDRGVWKAPANVSLNQVIAPEVLVTAEEQGNLNVDATSGKSVNAIRNFSGKGVLVWGSRTLAGNDNEWRYIPVRRLFIFIEESLKKATEAYVFEPNTANTWTTLKSMAENFLTSLWREGALAGAVPQEAFFVRVGLGETMSPQDILEGRLNIEIGMAAVRPAEFIILKFSHKLQES